MTRFIFIVITLSLLIPTFIQAQGQPEADNAPDTVIAVSGEGIYAILRRTERNPAIALPDFIALNKERLGNDSSLIKGKIYLIPPKALVDSLKEAVAVEEEPTYAESHPPEITPIVESLFGTKYSKVTLRDKRLEGAVYYLVTGHSGPDPGAIGNYGPYKLSEDEYAYDVTLRLARRLMEHGATVYMIVQDPDDGIRDDPILPMDKDEVHYPDNRIPASQIQRLKNRVIAINKLYVKHKGQYQRMLSMHIDSRSQRQNIDVFFYHHANSVSGKQLASSIHQTFQNKYRRHQPNRKYTGNISSRSSLYVVKHSYPPTVFIELGNIKNQKDQRRFVIPDNRQALANWIAEGILNDRSQ